MSVEAFENAVKNSKNLKSKPSNDILLKLYGLYKQATEGDVSGERPGGFDFKGAAKYDAWTELRGKDKELAAQEYIDLVENLRSQE
ncbi:MAG: acyl-CoA-binding protein [Bacteroidales bacterium]|nr:acyl-CoA-binding protein [Bacteroidales bacterium]MBN2756686.1 acyl-CoA-binding protein [Bacteroidales bacterium]